MSFVDTSVRDLFGIAWDTSADPIRAVVVGSFGTVLYSTGESYENQYKIYEFTEASRMTWEALRDVDWGNGRFVAGGEGGVIGFSSDGVSWILASTVPAIGDVTGIAWVTGDIWVATTDDVNLGGGGDIIRSTNGGVTWASVESDTDALRRVVKNSSDELLAVGDNGRVEFSDDDGATWTAKTSGVADALRDCVYANSGWYMVGDDSTILYSADLSSFSSQTSPAVSDFWGVAATSGLVVAVGTGAVTITTVGGTDWDTQKSGVEDDDAHFTEVEHGDNRYVVLGKKNLIAYSITGAGRPSFELFEPISDLYRFQCFTQQDAYMVYGGVHAYEEGEWNYYPRRVMNAAPGTVDDFTTVGWYFTDLPGTGAIMDMISIRGGIVIAETTQLSLLTDGGSLSSPWAYQQNYGEGLRPISNLASFNGVAFMVADDGLIYEASSSGVGRLQGFFDLTQFEDWAPSSESVWLQFDPVYQLLFVFRQKTPWTIWLVSDDSGGVSELTLPELQIGGEDYEPRSAFIIDGLHDGIHASYAPTDGDDDEIVIVQMDLGEAITGVDEIASGDSTRFLGDFQTGSFRAITLGVRGVVDEVLIRTWADPDSTARADVAVMVKEETEDDWLTNDQPDGTITVGTAACTGVGTAWSRYIAVAPSGDVSGVFTLPWLATQCKVYIEEASVKTLADYTITDTHEITLDTPLTASQSLYVNPGAVRPFVLGRVGDYILTEHGAHRISAVNTAYDIELEWYPPAEVPGEYLPAQEIPAGGAEGDGKIVVGLGRGFDQLMLRVLLLPHSGCDATGAKITGLELGYAPTGPELKTDAGG